jgi:cation:H+ antiporter
MPNMAALGLWPNLGIFALASVIVWFAGTKLASYAKTISDRTGAGQAFIGILLLGAVVSLPEMATTVSAAVMGNPKLAVNSLLGGIAIVMVIVAVVDAVTGPEPLSADISRPIVLLQGVLVVVFLTIAAMGMVAGDVSIGGVGCWTTALLLIYLLFIVLSKRYGSSEPWVANDTPPEAKEKADEPPDRRSTVRIALFTTLMSLAIVAAGVLLAVSADALGEVTGLGSSFVGVVLGGVATSLPEVSTTLAAVRLRQYEMAFADAFGTNLFSTMLLFAADAGYRAGPILNEVDTFSIVATLLAILLTAVYLVGFIERSRRTIMRMGIDSAVVLVLYPAGLLILFFMR